MVLRRSSFLLAMLLIAPVLGPSCSKESDDDSASSDGSGALDASFGSSGMVTTDFSSQSDRLRDGLVQLDGKLVAVGTTYVASHEDVAVVRYTEAGALDRDFATSGVFSRDLGGSADVASAIVQQPDGKLVLAGYTDLAGNDDFLVMRLGSNGVLDPEFGDGGIVTIDFSAALGTEEDRARAVAIQSDGKIVVAGSVKLVSDSAYDMAVARLDTKGSLDLSFGTEGRVAIDFGESGSSYGHSVAVQSDGKIVVAGAMDSTHALARLGKTGSLDADFAGTGLLKVRVGTDLGLTRVRATSDGKILAAGYTSGSGLVVLRLSSAGTLDTTFGGDGKYVASGFARYQEGDAVGLEVLSDGSVLGAGATSATPPGFAALRLSASGTADETFGTAGVSALTLGSGSAEAAVAIGATEDSEPVVFGYTGATTHDFAVARLKP